MTKIVHNQAMKAIMTINDLTTLTDLENHLQNNQPLAFSLLGNKSERYQFVQKNLVKFSYLTLGKKIKESLFGS